MKKNLNVSKSMNGTARKIQIDAALPVLQPMLERWEAAGPDVNGEYELTTEEWGALALLIHALDRTPEGPLVAMFPRVPNIA